MERETCTQIECRREVLDKTIKEAVDTQFRTHNLTLGDEQDNHSKYSKGTISFCWCPLLTKGPIAEEAQQYGEGEEGKIVRE